MNNIIPIILLNIFFLTSNLIFAQNTNSNEENNWKVILDEEFDNNNYNWDEYESENTDLYLRNGKYYININNTGVRSSRNIKLNTNNNFVIEAKFNLTSSKDKKNDYDTEYGLIWGSDSDEGSSNCLLFLITRDGNFGIYESKNGEYTILNGYKMNSDWINKSKQSSNTLTIIKTGSSYSFYVNEYLLHSMDSLDLYGEYIGFHTYGTHKIGVDYLYIVEGTTNNITHNNSTASPNVENDIIPKKDRAEIIFADNFNEDYGWISSNDEVTIKNGLLRIDTDKTWENLKANSTVHELSDINFEIETAFAHKLDRDKENWAYGIYWGGVDNGRDSGSYQFLLTESGKYFFRKWFNGEETVFIGFTESKSIKTDGSMNMLSIQRVDDM